MPYIGNVLTSFAVETGNINDQAVTAPKLSATGGTNGQVLALDAGGNLVWTSDPAGQWVTIGSDIYYDTGLVGIGTSSPVAKLQVNQNTDSATPFSVVSASANTSLTTDYASVSLQNTNTTNNNYSSLGFVNDQGVYSSSIHGIYTDHTAGAQSGAIAFATRNAGTYGEKVRITAGGNVGIGTTSPSDPLTISSNSCLATLGTGFTTFSGTDYYHAKLTLKDPSNRTVILRSPENISEAAIGTSTNHAFTFIVNNTERARIDTSGRLGIGTSSPSALLHCDYTGTRVGSTIGHIATTAHGDASDYTLFKVSNFQGATESVKLFVQGDGKVGIGTTSPNQLLQINSTSVDARLHITNSVTGSTNSDGFQIQVNNSDVFFHLQEAGDIYFQSNSSTRAIIDSSGNVGIGNTSPSSYNSDGRNLVVGSGSGGQGLTIASGTSNYGTIYFADGTSGDALYRGALLYNHAGDFMRFDTASTEKMRLDASGRLLVGTSSLSANVSAAFRGNSFGAGVNSTIYMMRDAANPVSGQALGVIDFTDSNEGIGVEIAAIADANWGAGDYPGRLVFSTTADGASAPTERMRILSNGATKISTDGTYYATSQTHEMRTADNNWIAYFTNKHPSAPYGITVRHVAATPNNTSNQFFLAEDTSGTKAEFRSNGGLANYSANNANLSDRNAKKDISPAAGTWDCIKDWEIVNYRYKDQSDDADLNLGVIAQQVAESCPEVITVFEEAKDDQPEKLGVKEQQMYWMAIKALQEAQVRIEALEAEVATFKAQ